MCNQLKRKVQLNNSAVYTSRIKKEYQSGGNNDPSHEKLENFAENKSQMDIDINQTMFTKNIHFPVINNVATSKAKPNLNSLHNSRRLLQSSSVSRRGKIISSNQKENEYINSNFDMQNELKVTSDNHTMLTNQESSFHVKNSRLSKRRKQKRKVIRNNMSEVHKDQDDSKSQSKDSNADNNPIDNTDLEGLETQNMNLQNMTQAEIKSNRYNCDQEGRNHELEEKIIQKSKSFVRKNKIKNAKMHKYINSMVKVLSKSPKRRLNKKRIMSGKILKHATFVKFNNRTVTPLKYDCYRHEFKRNSSQLSLKSTQSERKIKTIKHKKKRTKRNKSKSELEASEEYFDITDAEAIAQLEITKRIEEIELSRITYVKKIAQANIDKVEIMRDKATYESNFADYSNFKTNIESVTKNVYNFIDQQNSPAKIKIK